MAYQRRLSDHQMIAARWEYEATPISERRLAAKYGLSRSAIHAWITRQTWTRAAVPRSYEGEAGQRQFQRDVRAAIEAAGDKKIIQDLERWSVLPPAGKVTKVTKVATPGLPGRHDAEVAWEGPSDQPHSSENEACYRPPGPRRRDDQDGPWAGFPDACGPSPSPKTNPAGPLSARSGTEAARHDELALQQIRQLERHDALLAAYQRLLRICINPSQFVDVTGSDPAQVAATLETIRRQAARLVFPTAHDTLAGAITTLSKALIASLAAKRAAAGMTPSRTNGRAPPCAAEEHPPMMRDLSTLDLKSLRLLKAGADLLRVDVQRSSEPPKPPPPEPLEEMMARHDKDPSA